MTKLRAIWVGSSLSLLLGCQGPGLTEPLGGLSTDPAPQSQELDAENGLDASGRLNGPASGQTGRSPSPGETWDDVDGTQVEGRAPAQPTRPGRPQQPPAPGEPSDAWRICGHLEGAIDRCFASRDCSTREREAQVCLDTHAETCQRQYERARDICQRSSDADACRSARERASSCTTTQDRCQAIQDDARRCYADCDRLVEAYAQRCRSAACEPKPPPPPPERPSDCDRAMEEVKTCHLNAGTCRPIDDQIAECTHSIEQSCLRMSQNCDPNGACREPAPEVIRTCMVEGLRKCESLRTSLDQCRDNSPCQEIEAKANQICHGRTDPPPPPPQSDECAHAHRGLNECVKAAEQRCSMSNRDCDVKEMCSDWVRRLEASCRN